MKGKKKQIDNGAKSFRSLGDIEEFFDKQAEFAKRELNFFLAVSNITHEEEEAFAAAPASYDDMTEEDWQKEHEAQIEGERQLKHKAKFVNIRKFLEIGIKLKKDDPYSELFQTSKELLDLVDRFESDPSSVKSYERMKFRTALITYKELLKGEATSAEKPAETGQSTTPDKRWRIVTKKITDWIFKKTSHLIGTLIVSIIAGLIVAVLIDIFGEFGWLEQINAFIDEILWHK